LYLDKVEAHIFAPQLYHITKIKKLMRPSTAFIIRRLCWLPVTLMGVLLFIFFLLHAMPGDVLMILAGPRASPEMRAQIEEQYHLKDAVPIQLIYFIKKVLTGDFGKSIPDGRPVLEHIANALPNTIVLALSSLLLAMLIGIPVGAIAAFNQGRMLDMAIMWLTFIAVSVPDFVSGLLLLLLLAVTFNLFPVSGIGSGFIDQSHHLILPALALSLPWIGGFARVVRATMLDVLGASYIKMERSFGFPSHYIWAKYALRNAITPTISGLGIMMGKLLGGAVLIEVIFTRPGLGRLVAESIATRNIPVIRGSVLVTATLFVLSNLLADISYKYIDPRIQYEN
jgi:peptide/nickel transport system permease protein